MTIYIVAGKRRRLHSAERTETGLRPYEGCNLDQASPRLNFVDISEARAAAKAICRRCFP
jgi:hypothetical protein